MPLAPALSETSPGELLAPSALAVGLAVAVLSSVIPYSLESESLRRMPANVFGVLMSLEPAVAALAGFVVLGQHLSAARRRRDRARDRGEHRGDADGRAAGRRRLSPFGRPVTPLTSWIFSSDGADRRMVVCNHDARVRRSCRVFGG